MVPWRKGDFWSPREVPTCPNRRRSSMVEDGGAESGERSEGAIERERERERFQKLRFFCAKLCGWVCFCVIESVNSPWVNRLESVKSPWINGLEC